MELMLNSLIPGIPLAVATTMAFSELYGRDIKYCSNRKEVNERIKEVYGEKPIDIQNFNYDFTPDIILSDGYNYEASLRAYKNYNTSLKVLDAGVFNEQVDDLCKMVNYIICSIIIYWTCF